MQTSRLFIAMAVAAVALASCAKENSPINGSNEKTVSFIAESIETKTVFGTKEGDSYPTLWTSNKKVEISLNLNSSKGADVAPSEDSKTATFNGDFEDDETGSYTFYSVSPSKAVVSLYKDYKDWTIDIPANQTPTASSVDEAAQILVAKSSTFDSWPSTVSFNFSHLTAYGKMSLTNLNLGDGVTVTSVSITAAENWVGRWYYYVENYVSETEPHNEGDIRASSTASKTINLTTTSTSDLWFACAPVDLSGKKITVTVNTTAGPYEKVITWPADKPFTSGKVYKFSVDMAGIQPAEPKVYTKVTDKYDITVDSELIIVADVYDFAMSTTQNTNNRGQAAVTKSDNTISDPSENVQVFKAKAGSKTNTIAFYTGSGYIYATSGNNYLKTNDGTITDAASFSLSIAEGKATLSSAGATGYMIRYNSASTNGEIFSCYTSGQKDICIYKLDGSGTETPIFVNIPVTGVTIDETASIAVGETKTLTATIAPEDATNQNVSWASDDTGVATVDATGKVTGVAAGTATITVKTEDGNFTDECEVTVTAAAGEETSLDFTTKEYGKSAYSGSWTYGDWTIVNGSNYNKGWAFVKMGGKSETLSSANPCYIYNTTAISHSVEKITVNIASGSLSTKGMSVNSWGVYVYSDKEMTTQVDYVAGGTITNNAGSFDFTPSAGKTWAENYYYKISWNLANTTSTNGIVCVEKITLFEKAE